MAAAQIERGERRRRIMELESKYMKKIVKELKAELHEQGGDPRGLKGKTSFVRTLVESHSQHTVQLPMGKRSIDKPQY